METGPARASFLVGPDSSSQGVAPPDTATCPQALSFCRGDDGGRYCVTAHVSDLVDGSPMRRPSIGDARCPTHTDDSDEENRSMVRRSPLWTRCARRSESISRSSRPRSGGSAGHALLPPSRTPAVSGCSDCRSAMSRSPSRNRSSSGPMSRCRCTSCRKPVRSNERVSERDEGFGPSPNAILGERGRCLRGPRSGR